MSKKMFLMVAYHKDHYTLDFSKKYFEPIHVGKQLSNLELNIQGDHTGINISDKNSNYNELTALYWAWKNVDADYYGLMHYRRYFCLRNDSRKLRNLKFKLKKTLKIKDKFIDYKVKTKSDDIGTEFVELKKYLLSNVNRDIIYVPKRIEFSEMSIKTHYGIYHEANDWEIVSQIVKKKYPEFEELWESFENYTWLYAFNMFVMHKTHFQNYMEWLFDILDEVEKKVDIKTKDSFQARLSGFISERLFNFYLLIMQKQNSNIEINELNIVKLD